MEFTTSQVEYNEFVEMGNDLRVVDSLNDISVCRGWSP